MTSLIENMIAQHTDDVKKCRISPPKGPCPRCLEHPDGYKRHDCRERQFRLVSGHFVKIVISLLIRWKCPLCFKPFTDYPPFATPHKRFTLPDLESFSRKYIEINSATYRKTTVHDKIEIGYEDHDSRLLSHTTVWRWIEFWGSCRQLLKPAGRLKDKTERGNSIFKSSFSVDRHKYRSLYRYKILEKALIAVHACRNRFNFYCQPLFPDLRTQSSEN